MANLTKAGVCGGRAWYTPSDRLRIRLDTGIASPPDSSAPQGAHIRSDELARLSPERSDEIYNEFDFSDSEAPADDLITLSYGESISDGQTVDFRPFVKRAETVARLYHAFLQTVREVSDAPVRVRRREWFLASDTFVTVHICF